MPHASSTDLAGSALWASSLCPAGRAPRTRGELPATVVRA